MSPCSGWFPPGAKRSFPEGVRPFYGCKADGRPRDLGRPHSLTLPESLAPGLHHKGRDDVTMACHVTAGTGVDESAPPPWHAGTGFCRAFLSLANTRPCPAPSPLGGPRRRVSGRARASLGGPGMGGASRSHARLCLPPHPTLPRDRKAEPRLPEPPPPLLAVAVWGWRQLSCLAGDGRGCRYGDRSVALGAASPRGQTGPGPGRLLQLPGAVQASSPRGDSAGPGARGLLSRLEKLREFGLSGGSFVRRPFSSLAGQTPTPWASWRGRD